MKDLMIDLETMGSKSYCALVSIAAVPFDLKTGQIGDKFFYKVIDLQSCLDRNLRIEADTLYWWLKQPDEARKHIAGGYKEPIQKVLSEFSAWFAEVFSTAPGNPNNDVVAWGNSAKFDLGILENAYKVCNLPTPWSTWKEQCVRTLTERYGVDIKKEAMKNFTGIKHYPVDDCKHQIKYLCATNNRVEAGLRAIRTPSTPQ